MNRLAVTIWRGRVSPVFESAGKLLVLDIDDGSEVSRTEYDLPVVIPRRGDRAIGLGRAGIVFRKVERLREIGAGTLICGAISDNNVRMLVSSGIDVVGWVSGDCDEVISAFLQGRIFDPVFLMPGCRPGTGRQRRRRRGASPSSGKGWPGPGFGPAGGSP